MKFESWMPSALRTGLVLLAMVGATAADNTTYYVDFAGGSDGNDGRSPTTAWKRAPGDPQAGGNADATTLSAGQTVLFKGGVVYRGEIFLSRSGSVGSPITYKGDGWGSAKALLDGSAPYAATWTRCATAAECGGNPNFAQIYYAQAPAGYTDFQTALYENNQLLWYSQGPNPSDPFYHDEVHEFHDVPYGSSTVRQTQTSVTDPRHLTQTSAAAWNGAYVIAWITGNVIDIKRITSFNPATSTITHESLGNTPYTDRTGRYGLMNHVSLIDRAGEYAYDAAAGRIYLWPRNGVNPASNTYSVYSLDTAFSANGALNNVEIAGFEIRHFPCGIRDNGWGGTGLNIRNNHIHTMRSHNWYAIQSNASNSFIEGNRIVDANRAVGILSSASNIMVRNNHVERTSRQGIWFMGASSSSIVGNTVTNILGSHSNGISVYSGSEDIVISGNKVLNVNSAITYEASNNITFSNNIVDQGQISDWFGMTGTVAFYNNSFPRSNFSISSNANYIARNNILAQIPPGSRSHNIYTQSVGSLQTGESVQAPATLFVDHSAGDYRLKAGSPAIDRGTSVPLTVDINGVARPQGAAYDIGAYEYREGGSVVTPPAIATQPANVTVTAGQTASFTVAASGAGPLSYQWQRNGADIAGATSASYITPATTTSDSGATFRVRVGNAGGSVWSSSATLTVNAATAPAAISGLAPGSGAVGTQVVITGVNFTGASRVRFNGVSAVFTVVSATRIIAAVPSGATSGPVSVTTTVNTATSLTMFTVTNGAASSLPSGWSSSDIGVVGLMGAAGYQAGIFSVAGSGADIWGAADGFRFVSQTLTGDGSIVARVSSMGSTSSWAKAGVMMRETNTAGSRHAFCCVTPTQGVAFQRRLITGGVSLHTAGSRSRAPRWVKLVRQGTTVSGYESAEGVAWTLVGSATISMGSAVQIGLAVTSHNNNRLCTGVFDRVVVAPAGSG